MLRTYLIHKSDTKKSDNLPNSVEWVSGATKDIRDYYSPSIVEVVDPLLCVLLALELDVDVAHQMVSQVVAHIHLLYLEINSVSVRVYYRESEILAE